MHSHVCLWCFAEWKHREMCGNDSRTICEDCALDQLTRPTPNSNAFVSLGG